MKITAAVLREPTARFEIEELELADPRDDEVLVRMVGAGLCHTDLLSREWPPEMFPGPIVYGHEGAGIVEAVGSGRERRRGRATTSCSASTAAAVAPAAATSARTPVTTSSRSTSRRTVRTGRRR